MFLLLIHTPRYFDFKERPATFAELISFRHTPWLAFALPISEPRAKLAAKPKKNLSLFVAGGYGLQ